MAEERSASKPTLSVPACCRLDCTCTVVFDLDLLPDFSRMPRRQGRSQLRRVSYLWAVLAAVLCPAELPVGRSCGTSHVGLSALDALLCDLSAAKRLTRKRRYALAERACRWAEAYTKLADTLRALAGTGPPPWARSLREAAAFFDGASHAIEQLVQLPERNARVMATACVGDARDSTLNALEHIADALIRLDPRTVLSAVLPTLLDTDSAIPIAPALGNELVYLARAGLPALRVLALRALAYLDDPRAEVTLEENAREVNPVFAATARWVLNERANDNQST